MPDAARIGVPARPGSVRHLDVIVPGALAQRTGGFIYDARIVDGLGALGWAVAVHELEGAFPQADARARAALTRTLDDLPDGSPVVIDGLAMGGLPDCVRAHADRLPIVALVHHPLSDETGLPPDRRLQLAASETDALAASVGVIVTSDFTARRLSAFGVDTTRVRVVRPGTEPARRSRGPAAGDPPCLLCLGSVIPRKGQDVLVRALARVRQLSWRCLCAGSLLRHRRFAAAVRQQVRDIGLSDRVLFPGECDRATIDALYDAASIFVLPSHYEGYGMAFAEALARGLPVVGTTGGAIPDTVPADAGLLVPPGDEGALADVLRSLLVDRPGGAGPARRAELSAAARRHALALPTWADAVASFADAIIDLVRPITRSESATRAGRGADGR